MFVVIKVELHLNAEEREVGERDGRGGDIVEGGRDSASSQYDFTMSSCTSAGKCVS